MLQSLRKTPDFFRRSRLTGILIGVEWLAKAGIAIEGRLFTPKMSSGAASSASNRCSQPETMLHTAPKMLSSLHGLAPHCRLPLLASAHLPWTH